MSKEPRPANSLSFDEDVASPGWYEVASKMPEYHVAPHLLRWHHGPSQSIPDSVDSQGPVMSYDSRPDTAKHIKRVQQLVAEISEILLISANLHDDSKLKSPEVEAFDIATPKLATMTYGSDEYKQALQELGPALAHHYAENRHHPEHFAHGVLDMTLLDLIEMFCDWKGASERHCDGSFEKSIAHNRQRFFMANVDLARIFENTRKDLGW